MGRIYNAESVDTAYFSAQNRLLFAHVDVDLSVYPYFPGLLNRTMKSNGLRNSYLPDWKAMLKKYTSQWQLLLIPYVAKKKNIFRKK